MNAVVRLSGLTTRPMQMEDLPAVIAVEHACYSHPWTIGNFRDCLQSGYRCLLVEIDGVTCGHAVLSVGAGEAHVLNVCIHPSYQGRGAGRLLMQRLILLAGSQGADAIFLEVRSSNSVAQRLYDSLGFNEIGRRREYYPLYQGKREDALVYGRAIFGTERFGED